MKTICVAGLHISIVSGDTDFFDRRYRDYVCQDTEPDMYMETALLDEINEPEGELCSQIKASRIVKLPGGGFCRYIKSQKTGSIPYAIYYNSDYTKVRIELKKGMTYLNLGTTDWEYLYTGFMFANRITYLGGTVLHSSAMAYKHNGIVFSADPGTGKSTHVSLWKKKFGDDVIIVNDDKPAVRFHGDKAYIYGTPWSGKTDLNVNVREPLKAIVFIERAEQNSIERMSISDSVLNLSRQLPNPFYDGEVGARTVEFIKKIYDRGIPVYRLKCNISDEAVQTVYNEIIL